MSLAFCRGGSPAEASASRWRVESEASATVERNSGGKRLVVVVSQSPAQALRYQRISAGGVWADRPSGGTTETCVKGSPALVWVTRKWDVAGCQDDERSGGRWVNRHGGPVAACVHGRLTKMRCRSWSGINPIQISADDCSPNVRGIPSPPAPAVSMWWP